jgi:hypothetical protein
MIDLLFDLIAGAVAAALVLGSLVVAVVSFCFLYRMIYVGCFHAGRALVELNNRIERN